MAEVAGDRSGRRPLFPPEMQETGDIGAHLVGHGVEPGDVEGLWAVNVHASDAAAGVDDPGKHHAGNLAPAVRSEEHTSELQSLMRISYAVFCLKKKNAHIIKANLRGQIESYEQHTTTLT